MTQTIVYYLIALNIVTFFVYGIDKWRSISGTGRKDISCNYFPLNHV